MEKVIQFASDMSNMRLAENMVDEIAETYQVSTDLYGNVLISMVEAVSNAIIHGNRSDATRLVTVSCTHDDRQQQLVLRVSDEGNGFDYNNLPDPTAPENIEKPYGRGIFLIRNLSDELRFNRNGSQCEMIFYLD